jgi:hypothetical protein
MYMGDMGDNTVLVLFIALPLICGAALLAFARHLKRHPGTGWGRLALGNLLVLALLLSILFPAGEVYFRFLFDSTDSLNYTKVSQDWVDKYWVQNSFGFRDNIEYMAQRAPGTPRVSFVGDSFTAAHGVASVEDRFANIIRRAHPEWDVQVLAQLGYDTGDEIKLLQRLYAKGYQGDRVVLMYCLNDVSDMMPEWDQVIQRLSADARGGRGGWLCRHSYLLDFVRTRIKAMRDPDIRNYFDFVRRGYTGSLWETQKSRLRTFRDLVESHDGHLLVVIFPFFHDLGANYSYQPIHDQLDQFWREEHVPCLDLLPVYRNLPPGKLIVNRFDPHPNEYAHALAAEVIDKFLRQNLTNSPKDTIAR